MVHKVERERNAVALRFKRRLVGFISIRSARLSFGCRTVCCVALLAARRPTESAAMLSWRIRMPMAYV